MSTETFLTPDAGLISCDVFVREKVRGPEDVVCGFWDVVISTPAYVQGAPKSCKNAEGQRIDEFFKSVFGGRA